MKMLQNGVDKSHSARSFVRCRGAAAAEAHPRRRRGGVRRLRCGLHGLERAAERGLPREGTVGVHSARYPLCVN